VSDLIELCDTLGIAHRFEDAGGQQRRPPPDALVAVARAFGVPLDGPGDAAEALAWWRAREAQRALPPVVVAWNGLLDDVALHTAGARGAAVAVRGELHLVDGRRIHWDSRPVADDQGVVALAIPDPLPTGRHRLVLQWADQIAEADVLAAPARLHPGTLPAEHPGIGLFLPLGTAWSARRPDGGDLRTLAEVGRWVGDHGGTTLATLPLLAAFLDEPFEPSPYAPVSRRYWNELYLATELLPEPLRAAAGAAPAAPAFDAPIDPCRAMARRRPRLEAAIDELHRTTNLVGALATHLSEHPELDEYAWFRAAGERHGTDWRSWPTGPTVDVDDAAARYHRGVQWLMQRQMDGLREDLDGAGVHLYLDLPLGTHPDGFDVWHAPHLFASGVEAGAPPDTFFAGGQRWGFAPPLPHTGSDDAWRHFERDVDHHLAVAGLLRLDHVMALRRLYWVPEGAEAVDGTYVRYPHDELLAVLSLVSHRRAAGIVGEDLGTVEPRVRQLMDEHALRRMYVVELELGNAPERLEPPPGAVASMATHDLPTLAGWWSGDDLRLRQDLGLTTGDAIDAQRRQRSLERRRLVALAGLDPDRTDPDHTDADPDHTDADPDRTGAGAGGNLTEVHQRVLQRLAASEAGLVLVDVADLRGDPTQVNVPGTTDAMRSNWRLRQRSSVDDLLGDVAAARLLASLADRTAGGPPGHATRQRPGRPTPVDER
jgi:4-alpha-glucanotransferase